MDATNRRRSQDREDDEGAAAASQLAVSPSEQDGHDATALGQLIGDRMEPDTDADDPDQNDAPASPFVIVGIGASAGGLESLERMFRSMPVNMGAAFVVIQHLSPDFKSLMDELLSRYTELPIHRAEHGMPVEPNSVYLIPPKKEMIISNRRLLLTDKDPDKALSMPIDRFFRSLAQDSGKFAVGVILSGSGSDGSRGVRDIHAAGGLVVCESEETAKFDGMPLATLGTGDVDAVCAPEQIPSVIEQHIRQLPLVAPSSPNEPTPELNGIKTVFRLLNEQYGIDFSHYKPNTVIRRIQRRLSIHQIGSLPEYAERLTSDHAELNSLYRDLLIGVTRFFRDAEAFETLEREVLPELINKADDELRVWVAGCATGEEAYSLAILLRELLDAAGSKLSVKIFATDVHRASLSVASEAIYPEDSVAAVSSDRLERFFTRKPDGYHVSSELRQMLVFATHNVIKDAPFTKLDLIACRNLLIYFRPLAQKKAISLFHFGLRTGGALWLGPSETPGEFQDEFETIDPHWKMYRKSRDVRLPVDLRTPATTATLLPRGINLAPSAPPRGLPDPGLIGAYDALLARYMPPAILINERRELLHVFGGAERLLQVKPGRPSSDALDGLPGDLRTAVVGAVQRVLKDWAAVRYSGIRSRLDGAERLYDLSVEPVDNPRSRLAQLLIVLRPAAESADTEPASPRARDYDTQETSRERIEELESELRFSKENLQATIEELETSNEEMQATNEELVASNEELQSTNEELQSVNEELFTVNAEYQRKITELSELTADMDNLLESTDVGTIFLDPDLSIRKFTPQGGQVFHLLPQDIGRPIAGFSHTFVYDKLMEDIRQVRSSNAPCYREVRDQRGQWWYLRILPYRKKSAYEGIVLTLIDVTPLKQAEEKLSEAVRLRDEFLAMLSHELRNPLAAIQNASQLLNVICDENDETREACDVVHRQSAHLGRLLDDLLDVSRVTQRKIELQRQTCSVWKIVRNALEATRPQIDARRIDFQQPTATNPRLCVDGDPVRLQQALANVLGNAVKYTPPGGNVTLSVSADDDVISLRVRDSGIGIPPQKLDSIFDLFVQGEGTLHRSGTGMGIGLTLSRSIVELHGGTITARSDGAGRGSEFTIQLPRIAGEPDAEQERGAEFTKQSAAGRFESRVVIVEDSADNRRMLKQLLEVQGCEVFTAENGTKGLAVIEQYQPDIALIDIGLPGLDGYEVARQVRTNLGNTKTFLAALTGYGQPSDVRKALDAGFDVHLVKPVNLEKLRQILHSCKSGSGQ